MEPAPRIYELYVCPICGEQQPPGTVHATCSVHEDTEYVPIKVVPLEGEK